MAHFIDGKDVMISEWILLTVALVFVALRIYTRLLRLRQRLDWSDYLLLASAGIALGLIICDTLTYQMGVLDEYETSERLSKISFASNYFYDFGMGFPKLSMLAFYWAFFRSSISPGMRKTLYAITAFVCVCYLTILFDDTFFCGKNVSVQWSQEEGACSVFYAPEPFILNFTLNLTCYLVVYAIPLILLIQGVLASSTGLAVTFVFGTLTIFTTVVRFACLKIGTGQENLHARDGTRHHRRLLLPGLKPLLDRRTRGGSDVDEETVHVNHDQKV
ncbi:hypothetical protein PG997_014207 [Apiospora hydei]|uniref:Rhodopsin domain-containing protein n=1 Tax=Apiospora hydei TaxID=1337664 RepID=A0ABR1UT56_9PEZI